jgi:hypothetical protein
MLGQAVPELLQAIIEDCNRILALEAAGNQINFAEPKAQ